MSFLTDIQSSNTNIFPIVTIEPPDTIATSYTTAITQCIFLSTNSVTLDHIDSILSTNSSWRNHYFKPLLSQMPTINQSIDIKTRKFKVSNVTLNILNSEYNGQRFSDLFDDKSLINWKVSIQFVSPSAKLFSTIYDIDTYYDMGWGNISWYDAYSSYIPEWGDEGQLYPIGDLHMTKMVYQGRIRDAYQNKESVTLKLEDILGQKGHSSIPTIFTGHSGIIPEKYQGKPIPIVFGEVKRSPLVMNYSSDQLIIQADKYSDSENIGTAFSPASSNPLSVLKEDIYISIYNQHSDILSSKNSIPDPEVNNELVTTIDDDVIPILRE